MRKLFVTFVVSLFFAGIASAHEAPTAGFGTLSPSAPPETAQFAFMVGEWSCKTRGRGPDGSLIAGPDSTWTGYYILDGWAIQDDWVSAATRGTNIRTFNPKTNKWDNRWVASGSLQWKYYEAEQVGETMVMTGGEGVDAQERQFMDRNTFHEIGKTSWKWRKDRSFDGGKSWIEGVAFIHCLASDAKTETSDK